MAFLAASRSSKLNPKISSLSSSASLQSLLSFCSTPPPETSPPSQPHIAADSPSSEPPIAADSPSSEPPIASDSPSSEPLNADSQSSVPISSPRPPRRARGKFEKNPEKLDDLICRMMVSRPWTTRLQSSIRRLVPTFDSELVCNVLNNSKYAELALLFFRWTERSLSVKHDKATHKKIIGILGRAKKLNHARCILFDMPEKGVEWDEDMWVDMIQGYGNAGIVQESVQLFQKMGELGVERTIKSYNMLFQVILRRGRYMMAKRYFNKMVAAGIEPTTHTYNLMIWGFFLSKEVKTATRFFEDMKSRGLSPDAVTYNTMINGFLRVEQIEQAEKYFEEMKGSSLKPTVVTYTTLIKGYVAAKRVDDAWKMFEEMKRCGSIPSSITYSTLLPGLCDAEKMPEARAAVTEMFERQIQPKENSIFMRLITQLCSSGDVNAAADVLNAMIKLSIPTEAGHYFVIIEKFLKEGLYDPAVNLLDMLIEKEIVMSTRDSITMEPTAYKAITDYLCNNGQAKKAETLLRQLLKIGIQDSVFFNNLIAGHAKEGAPDSAYDLLKIMVRRKIPTKVNAYKALIMCYLNKGEPADAKIAFDSMIENGHSPNSQLYRSLMESLFEDGRIQTASRVMKTMVEKGVKEHMDLVSKILEALLMRGHVEEALGRIELLTHNGLKADFTSLTSVLCEKGKLSAAHKLIGFCLERSYDIDFSCYDKVLDALLAAGRTLNAHSILCKILMKGEKALDKTRGEQLIKSLNQEGNTRQADILSRMMANKDNATDSSHEKKEKKKKAAVA